MLLHHPREGKGFYSKQCFCDMRVISPAACFVNANWAWLMSIHLFRGILLQSEELAM